jgi:hypothetical protein
VRSAGTATQGEKVATLFDPDPPIAINRESTALGCLTAAIDGSPHARKGVALDAAIPEQVISKILTGVQGIPGGLIDALDVATLLDFMQRLGKPRGIEVRLVEASEINEQLLEAAQEMVRVIKIAATRGQTRR